MIMSKSRILIAMHYMEIGGAEMALVGLLNAFDYTKIDVDLFVYDHRGDLMRFIPKQVNLLPMIGEYSVLERPIVELVRRGYWSIAIARLWAKYKSKEAYKKSKTHIENGSGQDFMSKYTTPLLPKIQASIIYDLAISFHAPHRIVLEKVQAKKKIAWIHTDYTRIWVNVKNELPVWDKYDIIASISNDVTNNFIKIFPSLSSKIIEIENILASSFVRKKSKEFNVDWDNEMSDIQNTPPEGQKITA